MDISPFELLYGEPIPFLSDDALLLYKYSSAQQLAMYN